MAEQKQFKSVGGQNKEAERENVPIEVEGYNVVIAPDDRIAEISKRLLEQNEAAYRELAK